MKGLIPSTIGMMTSLTAMILGTNGLNGATNISNRSFYICLFCFMMNLGEIPSTVGSLTQLQHLYLDYNCLNGMKLLICIW